MPRFLTWTALLVVAALIVASAQTPELFDVVSVKAMGPAPGEALARFGSGCDGSFPRVENRRFSVTTTDALITWAYGFNKNGGSRAPVDVLVIDRAEKPTEN
jgi:hypothetical protein